MSLPPITAVSSTVVTSSSAVISGPVICVAGRLLASSGSLMSPSLAPSLVRPLSMATSPFPPGSFVPSVALPHLASTVQMANPLQLSSASTTTAPSLGHWFPPRFPWQSAPSSVGQAFSPPVSQPWQSSPLFAPPNPLGFTNTSNQALSGTPSLFGSTFPGAGVVDPGFSSAAVFPSIPGFSSARPSGFPPFVVGPGFPPVSPKLVAAIVSGDFVELSSLLDDPAQHDAPAFSLLVDQLVIRPQKRRKPITDIVAWMQAFSIYILVMTAYWPSRLSDLLRYQLLILRTAQQFPSAAWWSYDQAYRREAAAVKRSDWSNMNPELFHFHISGAGSASVSSSSLGPHSPQPPPLTSTTETRDTPFTARARSVFEARGSPSSAIICHSWNSGRCSSAFHQCRFRHSCDFPSCGGLHRRSQAHSFSRDGSSRNSTVTPSQSPRKRFRSSNF